MALLLLLISMSAFAASERQSKVHQDLNSYLLQNQFSGVIYIKKDQASLYKKAYGVKDIATQQPIEINDKFSIASITKQFTAAALLKLQDDGKLSLNDNVTTYIPQLKTIRGQSIRSLLNLTSGVPNYSDKDSDFWKTYEEKKILSIDDIMDFIVDLPMKFKFKKSYDYSNSAYVIAGKIIEVASGQSWDQYIKQEFLIPLKMNDTGYEDDLSKVSSVVGHELKDGKAVHSKKVSWSRAHSAAGFYSTAEDLDKWTAIYDDSNLLSKKAKHEMQIAFMSNYALGIFVEKYKGYTKIYHRGITSGFSSDLIYLKESKLKIIRLSNKRNAADDAAELALKGYIL